MRGRFRPVAMPTRGTSYPSTGRDAPAAVVSFVGQLPRPCVKRCPGARTVGLRVPRQSRGCLGSVVCEEVRCTLSTILPSHPSTSAAGNGEKTLESDSRLTPNVSCGRF